MNNKEYFKVMNLYYLTAAVSALYDLVLGNDYGITPDDQVRVRSAYKEIKRVKEKLDSAIAFSDYHLQKLGTDSDSVQAPTMLSNKIEFQAEHRFHVRPVPGNLFAVYYVADGSEKLIEPSEFNMEHEQFKSPAGVHKLIDAFAMKHGYDQNKCYAFYY